VNLGFGWGFEGKDGMESWGWNVGWRKMGWVDLACCEA